MSHPEPIDPEDAFRQLSGSLKRAALFYGFGDNERDALLRLMVSDTFAAEDVIIRQETITRNVWLLLEGTCAVIKHPPIGTVGLTVSLAQLQPFDVFGEMALISGEPHVASVEAKSSVRTLRLRKADFDELIDTEPRLACRLACNLLRILSERLRSVDEKLSGCLDEPQDQQTQRAWQELRGRLGKLYAGSPG